MKPRSRLVLIFSLLCLFCLGIVAARWIRKSPPSFNVKPLPRNARILSTAEVEQLLDANFTIVRTINQVPQAVKDDYSFVANRGFWMVNPGQETSTDAIIPGVPNDRLVLVGLANQTDVLIYERNLFIGYMEAVVVSHADGGGVWAATSYDFKIHDIPNLKKSVQKGDFTLWPTLK